MRGSAGNRENLHIKLLLGWIFFCVSFYYVYSIFLGHCIWWDFSFSTFPETPPLLPICQHLQSVSYLTWNARPQLD